MRITTGQWRGRTLHAPPNDAVRPTSDKVRQAIFNILLGYNLPGDAAVLDGFCGTGALGLEALSRGAAQCIFIDKARDSLAACRRNIAMVGAESVATVIERNVCQPGARGILPPAALLFLDPPYRAGLAMPALGALAGQGWLAPGAVCVVEVEREFAAAPPLGFTRRDDRTYGGTRILFLQFTEAQNT